MGIIREVKDAQHVFQKLQGFVFTYGTAILQTQISSKIFLYNEEF